MIFKIANVEVPEGYEPVFTFKDGFATITIKEKESIHAELIAQCEQNKIDYPDFWWELWQLKAETTHWDTFYKSTTINNDCFYYRRHPHRDNIIAWHACSDDDKKRWEIKTITGKWESLPCFPTWHEDREYRLNKRTCFVTLQDGTSMEYPEPLRKKPKLKTKCFLVSQEDDSVLAIKWEDYVEDNKWLRQGYIQLTEIGAQQHLAVLQAINNQVAL